MILCSDMADKLSLAMAAWQFSHLSIREDYNQVFDDRHGITICSTCDEDPVPSERSKIDENISGGIFLDSQWRAAHKQKLIHGKA